MTPQERAEEWRKEIEERDRVWEETNKEWIQLEAAWKELFDVIVKATKLDKFVYWLNDKLERLSETVSRRFP